MSFCQTSQSLILTQTLTQTLTLILTLIPTLALTLTQTEEKHYFASRGKIATSFLIKLTPKLPLSYFCQKIQNFQALGAPPTATGPMPLVPVRCKIVQFTLISRL